MSDAELRSVTVLFADVQGSTSMVQHLDAEQAAHLIGPALDIMWKTAEQYDGEVSPRGDGIRATFGPPRSAEDHGLRACLCALTILDRLAASQDDQLKVRVGIHSGDVVIQGAMSGRGRVREIFGSTVHVAARLEQTADTGTACISAATFGLVRDFVHVAPAAPVTAKGIDAPLKRYVLLGMDVNANRWRVRALHGLSPMVGRQTELTKLRRLIRKPMPPGLTLTRVTGPAGSGKSRLAHEFLATTEAREYHKVILTGASQRSHVPLGPVVDWLRELLRTRSEVGPGDTDATVASKLELLGVRGAWEAERLQALLNAGNRSVVDLTDIVRGDTAGLVAVIIAVLRSVAGSQPVLLVCEDIDNFDRESLDFLTRLPGCLVDHPIMVLATSRSRSRLALAHAARSVSIELPPLEREQAQTLVDGISKQIACNPPVLNAVLGKAGGNPLFIEELCCLMLEGGKAEARPNSGPGAVMERIGQEWRIPDRIETIITDRISRLPRQLQSLLRLCAVIGLEVPLWLISRISRKSESIARHQLARLENNQILYEEPSPSGSVYRFKHELAQEVIYRSILESDRIKIHAEIVETIEGSEHNATDHMLEQLSLHAVQGRIWSKAVRYLQRMARFAAERSGLLSANKFLRDALACLERLPHDRENERQRLNILMGLHVLAILDLRYRDAERLLDEAQALSGEIGDREMLITAMGRRVRILNVVGRLDEAATLARRAQAYANQSERPNLVPFAAHFLGQTLFFRGELNEANAVLTSAIACEPGESDVTALRAGNESISCLTTRGAVRGCLADFQGALQDCDEALRLATAAKRQYDMAFARFGRGLTLLYQRDLARSATEFRHAVQIAQENETTSLLPTLQTGVAHALLRQGKFVAAEPLLQAVTRIPPESNRRMILIWATIGLSWLRLRSGDSVEARELIEHAADDAARLGYRCMLVEALRAKSLVLLGQSPARAADCATQALNLADDIGMTAEKAHCLLALASCHRGASLASEVLASYRHLRMDGWARRVRRGLSEDRDNLWYHAF